MARPRRRVRVLRLSWPVAGETLAALLAGRPDALERDPSSAALFAVLRADNPLGDFGLYRAVAEISPCWELFQPQDGANPTLGNTVKAQVSTNLMVTIHVDAATPEAEFDAILDRLVTLHPWEVPVIEIAEAELAMRVGS